MGSIFNFEYNRGIYFNIKLLSISIVVKSFYEFLYVNNKY